MEVTIPGMPGILPWYLTSYVAVGGCVGTAVPTLVAFAPQWPWHVGALLHWRDWQSAGMR